MKKPTNTALLTLFSLSLMAYVVIFLAFIQYGGNTAPAPLGIYLLRRLHAWLALSGHAVPFFCLQLLLCRLTTRKWPALLLTALLCGWLGYCVFSYVTSTGWDTLGWAILLAGTAAPAVGCALAWVVYLIQKRRDSNG